MHLFSKIAFYNKYYKHFLTCSICYNNCYFDDKLKCSLCDKYCHRSCVNVSKRKFDKMLEGGVNRVICSNKCCAPILPFFSISTKAFLDVNVGKRKSPCKICFRECFKKKNCSQCEICAKSFHNKCISNKNKSSLIFSKACEMKLLPFSSVCFSYVKSIKFVFVQSDRIYICKTMHSWDLWCHV